MAPVACSIRARTSGKPGAGFAGAHDRAQPELAHRVRGLLDQVARVARRAQERVRASQRGDVEQALAPRLGADGNRAGRRDARPLGQADNRPGTSTARTRAGRRVPGPIPACSQRSAPQLVGDGHILGRERVERRRPGRARRRGDGDHLGRVDAQMLSERMAVLRRGSAPAARARRPCRSRIGSRSRSATDLMSPASTPASRSRSR